MADAADSKSVEGNFMRVRVSPSAKVEVLIFAWLFIKPLYFVGSRIKITNQDERSA